MHSFAVQQTTSASPAPRAANHVVQPKLRIGPVDDPLEREADRAADAVMAGDRVPPLNSASSHPQRKCAECAKEDERMLQRKQAGPAPTPVYAPSIVQTVLSSPGEPLDATIRAYFEPRFGRDFSGVRVHRDGSAARSADILGAHAYTTRQHVVFGAGQFMPGSTVGNRLIAHELGHTIQQLQNVVPVVQRRPRMVPGAMADKPSIVSVTAHQGSKTGQATLSDGTSTQVELTENALPVGDYKFSPTSKLKGRTAQGLALP